MLATLEAELTYDNLTGVQGKVVDPDTTWYNSAGTAVSSPTITIRNQMPHGLPSGWPVYCEFDPVSCIYNIVETPPLTLMPFMTGLTLLTGTTSLATGLKLIGSGITTLMNSTGGAANSGLLTTSENLVAKAVSDISARSSSTEPAGGVCQVYKMVNGTLTYSNVQVTGYNLTNEPISSDNWLILHRNNFDGQYYVGFEDCTC